MFGGFRADRLVSGQLMECLSPLGIAAALDAIESLQGTDDDVVPEPSVEKLANKLKLQKNITIDYQLVKGANHFFKDHMDNVTNSVNSLCSLKWMQIICLCCRRCHQLRKGIRVKSLF